MIANALPSLPSLAQASPSAPPIRFGLISRNLDVLLPKLLANKWQRLQPEYDDPLGMLFCNQVRQWTLGWGPASQSFSLHARSLYLLIWQADSWQDKGQWLLYENGELILEETDGDNKARSQVLQKLMESKHLPVIGYDELFDPLLHGRHAKAQRKAAAQALLGTILARPEVLDGLKAPLFDALETQAQPPATDPNRDVLRLHRFSAQNRLTWLFCQLLLTGHLPTLNDQARLDQALVRLQAAYSNTARTIAPLFLQAYQEAYDEFRQLLTDGAWRVKLRMRVASHEPAPDTPMGCTRAHPSASLLPSAATGGTRPCANTSFLLTESSSPPPTAKPLRAPTPLPASR